MSGVYFIGAGYHVEAGDDYHAVPYDWFAGLVEAPSLPSQSGLCAIRLILPSLSTLAIAFSEKSAIQIFPSSSIHIPSMVRSCFRPCVHISLVRTFPGASNVILCIVPSPKLPTNKFPDLSKTIPSKPY